MIKGGREFFRLHRQTYFSKNHVVKLEAAQENIIIIIIIIITV